MAKAETDDEPSMEEILTSIRKIIADEQQSGPVGDPPPGEPEAKAEPAIEAVAEVAVAPPADPAPEPEPVAAAPEPEADDEVIDLTPADEAPAEAAVEPEPEPEPEPDPLDDAIDEPAPAPVVATPVAINDDQLIGEVASDHATTSLQRLSQAMTPATLVAGGDKTIEVFLAEQLREPLRVWLDANLPGLVEGIVEREIKKLVRTAEGGGTTTDTDLG